VMLAGRYTLLEQDALDDLLPLCTERGVGVIAAGIFNSGLLARAEPQSQATYNYEQAPPELIGRARDRCRLQSPRDHAPRRRDRLPPRSSGSPERRCRSAFGRSDPARADLFNQAVPHELWSELRAEGLLRDDAPVPR